MKTIKELADSIKVSKVSIYNAIKKDNIKPYVFIQDGLTLVDEIGAELLIALFNKEKNTDDSSNNKVESKDDYKEFIDDKTNDIISILKLEIEKQDNEIKEKNEQINSLKYD
jgi:hypothetical protein